MMPYITFFKKSGTASESTTVLKAVILSEAKDLLPTHPESPGKRKA